MENNSGELMVYNPNKEISKEIVLDVLIRHRDYCKQADTGELPGITPEKMSNNEIRMNQIRGLNRMILAQKQMITISRSSIENNSTLYWIKKNKTDEEQKQNPFEDCETDFNELMEWLYILTKCQMEIRNAKETKSVKDDFILKNQDENGEYFELTDNFYEMREDLDTIYAKIYLLMMKNKIVSSGKDEDESLLYKELEEEGMRRIIDA